jgi:hypothetical protein
VQTALRSDSPTESPATCFFACLLQQPIIACIAAVGHTDPPPVDFPVSPAGHRNDFFLSLHIPSHISKSTQWPPRKPLLPPRRTSLSALWPEMVCAPFRNEKKKNREKWSLIDLFVSRQARFRCCTHLRLFQRYLRSRYRSLVRSASIASVDIQTFF